LNLVTNQFDLGNAQACAVLSMVAYGRSGALAASQVMLSVPETDTYCLVQESDDCIVVAFRGTDSIRDWITDAKFFRELYMVTAGVNVEVHEGFLEAWRSILPVLNAHLKKISVADRKIFITGHSLGGALGILSALQLKCQGFQIAQVYTFGQPRVGNGAFKRLYDAALGNVTFRLVYQEDIVPRLPHLPSVRDPYRHCGREVFISSTTPVRQVADLWINPPVWRLLISDAWGIYRAFTISKFAGALDPIRDHFIINYTRALEGIQS